MGLSRGDVVRSPPRSLHKILRGGPRYKTWSRVSFDDGYCWCCSCCFCYFVPTCHNNNDTLGLSLSHTPWRSGTEGRPPRTPARPACSPSGRRSPRQCGPAASAPAPPPCTPRLQELPLAPPLCHPLPLLPPLRAGWLPGGGRRRWLSRALPPGAAGRDSWGGGMTARR